MLSYLNSKPSDLRYGLTPFLRKLEEFTSSDRQPGTAYSVVFVEQQNEVDNALSTRTSLSGGHLTVNLNRCGSQGVLKYMGDHRHSNRLQSLSRRIRTYARDNQQCISVLNEAYVTDKY